MNGAPWTPCPCCENYLCKIHGMHAHDCPCPALEDWGDVNPYAQDDGPSGAAAAYALLAAVFALGVILGAVLL